MFYFVDFYLHKSSDLHTMNVFLNECSIDAYDRLWPNKSDKDCQGLFAKAALGHMKQVMNSENLNKYGKSQ